MTDTLILAQRLADAHKAGRHDVDPAPYSQLDRAEAFEVQRQVMSLLGETPGLYKTAIAPDGIGAVAPIYKSHFGQSGSFSLPQANVIGLELEVGLVLARDLKQTDDERAIIDAIDHYFVGVEVCGTRYTDRAAAGYNGGLADGMSHLAYVMSPTHRASGADIQDAMVQLEFAGASVFDGPAKHSFGTVQASFIAYAKEQQQHCPLRSGTVVTTGSLCGLVPISGTGHVLGRLGSHVIEFDIV